MFGHLSLAIPNINSFYIGLILVVLGTGLIKAKYISNGW